MALLAGSRDQTFNWFSVVARDGVIVAVVQQVQRHLPGHRCPFFLDFCYSTDDNKNIIDFGRFGLFSI